MILLSQPLTEGGHHFPFLLNKSFFDGSPSCELNKRRCSSGFSALNGNQSPQCDLSVLITNTPNLTAREFKPKKPLWIPQELQTNLTLS